MRETSESIDIWAEEAFGPVASPAALVDRAMVELRELRHAVAEGEYREARAEAADVTILLHRLCALLGTDLHAEVDAKMRRNRERRWARAGDGTGSHIKGDAV